MAEDIQETTILARNFPPRLPGNKLALQYRIESPSAEVSNWSPVYYLSAPTVITNNTISTLTATDAESYSFQWTDDNPVDEYDVFVAASIDCENFTLNRRSVGTTKYLYATTSNVLIANEFNRFYVDAKIDVKNISSALNGDELVVTEVNTSTSPYYIKFTGDSSDTLGNTETTSGGFYLSPISVTNPATTTMLSKYEYVGTAFVTNSDDKTFLYKSTRKIISSANIDISASVLTNNVATITTSTAHGFSTGTVVQISERPGYNGLYTMTNTGSTTFTVNITSANIASNTTDGGTVTSVRFAQSLRSVALTQIACSTKVADLSLFVVGSPSASLV